MVFCLFSFVNADWEDALNQCHLNLCRILNLLLGLLKTPLSR